MADFIDFSQQLAATGDDERKLLEAAMARAQDASDSAKFALNKAGRDAGGHYGPDGQITGETSLSESASYSDYLNAKGAAEKAWAAVAAEDVNPRSIRNVFSGRAGAQGQMNDDALGAKESSLDNDLAGLHTGLEGQRAKAAADAEAKKATLEEQKKAQAAAKQAYVEALVKRSKGRAAAGGAQTDYVGGYNPAASSSWAQSQGAKDAADARAGGASEDQVRAIWNNYTQKGEFGSGHVPGGGNDYMDNAMEPWAPKKEES